MIVNIAVAPAWPLVAPEGTTYHNPQKAFGCYTLYAPMEAMDQPEGRSFPVYLINMSGAVVHQWKVPFVPLQAKLQPNGNVVISGLSPNQTTQVPRIRMKNTMGGYTDNLVELDWQGKTVFKYENEDLHHDFIKLPNGNYLSLAWGPVIKPLRDKVRGGFKGSEHIFAMPEFARKDYLAGKYYRGMDMMRMFNDYLVEINPQGKVVWKWQANPHLDPAIDIIGPIYKREEWLHANSISVLKNGNLVLTSRNTDSILIIDRKTGKIIQRWGNVAYLDKKSGQIEHRTPRVGLSASGFDETLGGPHDAQVIPDGYPGAGHITIFNNGVYTGTSRVLELNLSTGKVVWQSQVPALGRTSFSPFMGSAQRLPNGNTLICEGINGRFYQVTRDNEIVWEFVNPYDTSPLFRGAVYQAHAYTPDYCPQLKSLALNAERPIQVTSGAMDALKARATNAEKTAFQYRTALIALSIVLAALVAFLAGRKFVSR